MKRMIESTLDANPNAYLFGGAVRDMVLERHQFGQDSHEYDEAKSVVSNDLDFCVSTQTDFLALQKFFLDQYHIKPVESKYPGTNFSVVVVRDIPLVTGSYLNKRLSISVDLVWRKDVQLLDFDVNSLVYNKTNGISVVAQPGESPIDSLFRLTNIVEHIKHKTAFVVYSMDPKKKVEDQDDEVSDSETVKEIDIDFAFKVKIQQRAYSLMTRGWEICMRGEDTKCKYHFIRRPSRNNMCTGKDCKEIAHVSARVSADFLAQNMFCQACWVNLNPRTNIMDLAERDWGALCDKFYEDNPVYREGVKVSRIHDEWTLKIA